MLSMLLVRLASRPRPTRRHEPCECAMPIPGPAGLCHGGWEAEPVVIWAACQRTSLGAPCGRHHGGAQAEAAQGGRPPH